MTRAPKHETMAEWKNWLKYLEELGYETKPPFEIGGENHYKFRFRNHPECVHFLTDGNPTRPIKPFLRSQARDIRQRYDDWLKTLPEPIAHGGEGCRSPAPKRTRSQTAKERRGQIFESEASEVGCKVMFAVLCYSDSFTRILKKK